MPLSRRVLLGAAPALLAACATPDTTPNHQALASLRRVAVPPASSPAQPIVQVTNPVSQSLGILGRIASDAAGDTRANTLQTLLAAQDFRPGDALQAAVIQRLTARGLTATSAVPADATMDLSITRYGFVAPGDRSTEPFRPVIDVSMQVTSARDGSILLRGTVTVDDTNEAPGTPTFSSFVDIESSPARVAASLRQAFGAAADGVAGRLA